MIKYHSAEERRAAQNESCRRYRATDKAKVKSAAKQKIWQQNNKHKPREYLLRNKYGLTVDQYKDMILAQNNKCAICETDMKETFIDHNHDTGIVRGVLCRHCNLALGHVFDSKDILSKAINYLNCH
jgi:spore coat polysaccharide biosynthesis predicted glycosyltransferase SpsG